ncbi:hypothetical protein N9N67_07420 [Bacteriovoracaceae bacterium]|nr:hypothetical protein [Bacteriovoracaceae bacterium]
MEYRILLIFSLFFFESIFAKEYNHSEFINLFKKKNISDQVEIIKLQQSRINIQQSMGRIVPSLNLSTIIDTTISGPIGLLNSLSNLLGFLLPSRWFAWNESKMYYLSQYHSYIATRGNLILMADELYLTLKKVYLIRNLIIDVNTDLGKLVHSIEFREKIGELPKGSFARVKTKSLELESDLLDLDNMIELYLIEINKLIVDESYSKISIIDYISEREIEESSWELDNILEVSPELKSLKALFFAAKYSKKKRAWSFLSFSNEGFGLGYFARNKLATTEIKQIKNIRLQEEMELSALFHSISKTTSNLDKKNHLYTKALESLDRRLEQIKVDYQLTGKINSDDYLENLDAYLKFKILKITNKIDFEFTSAKKERVNLVGIYSKLDQKIPKRQIRKLKRYQKREDRLVKNISAF